ncbi:MAG: HlyD family type I secretion periplasmic adaptor subunit [Hyphomicrobiales bacterium]|nr:HlyD family type I secretion periplasmic adaptor subunit [Hyphomicrobiales bacterium]
MQAAANDQQVLRKYTLIIVGAAVLLVFGLGGWAATTEFFGAVIAPGQIVVDSNSRKVQHPSGGIVGELLVRDGDVVEAAAVVVRLDDTQTRANLGIVLRALDELAAREARQEAERRGAKVIEFPGSLMARIADPEVAKAVNGERQLFETRRAFREGQKAQLRERSAQLREEIAGYQSQIASKARQVEWIEKELEGVRGLWEQNLVPIMRLTALERERERLAGETGQLTAAIAQARGKIIETDLQILQIDETMRAEVGKELAEIRARTAELVEKRTAAEDQLRRVEIRAPIDGVVHQLAVHTVGGVIAAGEPIMLIVPQADVLSVEARIAPQDIDQLRIGQAAVLRFVAFNQRTTPELNGHIARISADVSEDAKTGLRFYTIRISVPDHEISRLAGARLMPGMPVEALIQTSPRTVLSYFVKPFQDHLSRAFREH